jgi:DNA-damage-inducible protein J
MSTSTNIRMDTEIKKQAEALFSELGLNMTTAVNMFLRQAVRQHGIPFELKIDAPNAETLVAMSDVNNHHNMSQKYSNTTDVMEALNADH